MGESVLAANGQKAATFAARLMAIADSARDSRLEAEEREDPRIALAAARMEAEVLTNLMARLGVGSDDVARELEEARDVFAAIRDAAAEHPELWEILAPAMERKSYFLTATNMRRAALTARERLANAAENAPALEGADTDVSGNEKG